MIGVSIRNTIGFMLVLVLIAIAYLIGAKIGQLPEVVYQAPLNDTNLVQWRKNWRQAGDSIVSATVVANSGEKMFVYVDYIYSGSHGDKTTTCGSIVKDGGGGDWSCSPTGIGKGRGFVTLRFALSSKSRETECSDGIRINYYDEKGSTFFEKTFPFQKTWIKDEQGVYGKIREILSICPSVE